MFDLEREVALWCEEVVGTGCIRAGDAAELQDHVLCLVTELRSHHQSDEAAFAAALAQMGATAELRKAYLKGRPWLHRAAAWDQALMRKLSARYTGRQLSRLLLLVSVVFAALILGISVVAPQAATTVSGSLTALWLVPFLLVTSLPKVRRAECAALRRLRWG